MRVVTGAEMQALEKKAFASLGLSALVVMETAGSRIVEVLRAEFAPLESKRIHILAGPGNNGGDGLVAARQLLTLGTRVKVYLVNSEKKPSRENAANLAVLQKLGADITPVNFSQLNKLKFSLSFADVIVDAVLGTGFSGRLDGDLEALAKLVNEIQCPVVAVDCPTGVNSNTGEVQGIAIESDLTINLGLLKLGCLLYPGQAYAGKNIVVDLGFPLVAEEVARELVGEQALNWLPERKPWSHKGTHGHTLVVAGSLTYAGAASLCAQAVLRGGGGMVTAAVPEGIYNRFPPDEVIVVPVSAAEGGTLGEGSLEKLRSLTEGKDVLAIGPGLGRGRQVVKVVQDLLSSWNGPAVIDADGLAALSLDFLKSVPQSRRRKWVLTPHPGEMARLLSSDAATVNADRVGAASSFAQQWDLVVVLKGAPTITASSEQVYINSTGNHGLATAGTGDVLTGLIAALLGQGLDPLRAGALAAYVHGKAGDRAAVSGARGVRASDCLNFIQEILR
ncbi:MAG: NAD(P)H-hydrate dehydratase [Bacillota bacterium]|jgi:hydroxyethylthiazole kinase-like uncharacterized protein yjeF|nr:NAD(P)H-hydrate dehydratase [Bacillota bacterium]